MTETLPGYLRFEVEVERGPSERAVGSRPLRSDLRGALGKALVDLFCTFGEPRCRPNHRGRPPVASQPDELCRLASACPYGVLFAASLSRRPPFSLCVPEGNGLSAELVEITLYGPAWRSYAWVLSALEQALSRVGLRVRPGQDRAAVRRVAPDRRRQKLAGADLAALPADLAPDLLGLAPEPFVAPRPVVVELVSPTQLLSGGEPLSRDEPVPFDVLVKSTLDRFAGLYGDEASPVLAREFRATVEAEAEAVPLLEQELRVVDMSDDSRRSRRRLDLGGAVGRLVYGPRASAFVHILRAAEILHLGKNPTYGCGRVRVDLVE